MIITERDASYLDRAILLAEKAFEMDEVPVGSVVVENDSIIADGFNEKESFHDPLRHAEIVAMQRAAQYKNDWRLNNCSFIHHIRALYYVLWSNIVILEIKRVVFV